MSLLDRLNREKEAAQRRHQAELDARAAADRAREEQKANERAAQRHVSDLYHESPCGELMEQLVNHMYTSNIANVGTEYFGDGISSYGVRIYWNREYDGRHPIRRGRPMEHEKYKGVSAEMRSDGTLFVWGKRRKKFSLSQWRNNPDAVDAAIEDAYANPEHVDKWVPYYKPEIEDIGE
jgi:hypothetical protein